jgi:hypothetical protein
VAQPLTTAQLTERKSVISYMITIFKCW